MTTTTIITPRPETRTDTVLRSRSDDVHAVPAALRSEWIKVSTLRTNKVILGLTAGIGATIAAALAATATDATAVSRLGTVHLPAPARGHVGDRDGHPDVHREAQHGTLAVTLAARPARWVIVVAKTAMAVAVGATYGAAAMAAGFAGALAGGAELGDGSAITVTGSSGRCCTSRSPRSSAWASA
jgi:ABC-2 type transport system permease protein